MGDPAHNDVIELDPVSMLNRTLLRRPADQTSQDALDGQESALGEDSYAFEPHRSWR